MASRPHSDPTKILEDQALMAAWGINGGDEGRVHGDGDQKIVDAFDELKKKRGGDNPPNWLHRLSATRPAPACALGRCQRHPADIILSYSHHNLQNHSFEAFAPLLSKQGQAAAHRFSVQYGLSDRSYASMAPRPSRNGVLEDNRLLKLTENWPGGLPNLAAGYAFRRNSG
ncbi:hypothetical protein RhiXN_03996 [Rhizoctonia solani]|uniref:Uncharacterized protein n=1 Tax=Rhizoctonia solani TaxID=456999 RepID=A0A8H8NMP3_9AGAM|nr:uncharacterized protein RhiXN_03996 [Rhizoctonia solani]QRW15995.1 hypothetical protein RhiXN_03996 [Rhizoctonia solani]